MTEEPIKDYISPFPGLILPFYYRENAENNVTIRALLANAGKVW